MNSSAMMSPTMSTRRARNRSTRALSRSLAMTEDPAGSANQVVDDRIGGKGFGRPPLFDGAVSRPDQDAAAADDARQLDIQPPVADDEGPRGIDAELFRGTIDQSASRL